MNLPSSRFRLWIGPRRGIVVLMAHTTATLPINTRLFNDVVDATACSASVVRRACKALAADGVDQHKLTDEAVALLIDYLKPACTSCGNNHSIHPDVKLCPTGYNNKETTPMPATATMPATVTDAPATQTPRKRSGSTTRTTDRAASSTLTAASVARDNELDPRKFRAFLRSNDIDRTFANKTAVNKAVKAFKKSLA